MFILWSKNVGGWNPEYFDHELQMDAQAKDYANLGIQFVQTESTPSRRDNFNNSARVPGKLGE